MNSQHQLAIGHNQGWFFLWGIAFIILGGLAISFSVFTTLISIIFLGAIIFAGGIIMIFDTFKFWWHRWGGFSFNLLLGIIYLFVGFMLFQNPLGASLSLTLLLGIFYVVIGVFRMAFTLMHKHTNWGWAFFGGLISLILGIMILASWPASSLFIIGLFVGIDLLVCGWVYIMLGLSGRKMVNNV